MGTLILTAADCEGLLDHPALIEVLSRAFSELATGGATQPVPSPMRGRDDATIDGAAYVPMPAYAPYLGRYAVKLLADVPSNRSAGLPAQRSTIALWSTDTAACLALADGRIVTRMRTAATTALATATLARPGAEVLGLIGSGALAVEHLLAHREVMPLRQVVVWSRSDTSRDRLRQAIAHLDVEVRDASDIAQVFQLADVVCSLTPAEQPIVSADMLRPGLHLNAIGSPPRPSYRELEPGVLAAATLVTVDHRPLVQQESGNVRDALASGAVSDEELIELGAILAGLATGREHANDITVFNSVGMGLQDLVALDLLHRRAQERGIGTEIDLRA
jgi:alanine dehydrogenase